MRNAIIVHGFPQKSEYESDSFVAPNHNHWLPWLQKELLKRDIYAEAPIMPEAYMPDYEKWKKAVERCDHIGEDTIIVGHSCGGGFWVRYLSEHPELKVGKVVLVAPWIDPEGSLPTKFHQEYNIDADMVARTKGITIFSSDNERHESVVQSIKILDENINNLKIVGFHNYGHFCLSDMKTDEFPELLQEVLA
ncbi:alpha/beta hydrolase [Candidatus Saccharibacteria bacterium]|nr:alpha/beta hydrolase [Candidatus Saccharibacteria bacterium]